MCSEIVIKLSKIEKILSDTVCISYGGQLTITPWNPSSISDYLRETHRKMLRKQVVISKKVSLIYILRYGLVVRIPGSHPGGPGSIPGNGNFFLPLNK